ncbi:MAG: hypothetical protein M1308_14970, partial [Actinobacteria bacterium]|nr:hypothetical protein [Actinomycetota bacterium]
RVSRAYNLFNFDSQPREAFPYLFLLLLSIFNKLGYFNISNKDIERTAEFLGQYRDKFKTETPFAINLAKALASRISGKVPLIYAGGYLKSVAKRFKSQFNENAKTFSFAEAFPELNHNVISGFEKPKATNFVIILESNYDFERIIKQENITAVILRKFNIELERVKFVPCDSPLSEILLMVMLGDFVSCYLGILNGVNLSDIKNVIFLKNELER